MWYEQALQGAFDPLVRRLREILAPAFHLASQIGRHVEGLAHVIQQGLAALGDGLAARVDQAGRPALLLGKDDLGERHLGQVVPAVPVDDLYLVALPDELRDSFERDVATRALVGDLPVCLLLAKLSLAGRTHAPAHSN